MRAEAMAAYTRLMLEPLVQTVERQAEEIAGLREERGRQSAELERAASAIVALVEENEALRASQAQQDAKRGVEHADPTPAPSPSRWRVLASWVALLVMLALATVTLLLTLVVLALT